MNKRLIILAAAAIGAALMTAMLARNWLDSERQAIEATAIPQIEIREVLVARRPLAVGNFIKNNDLKWQPWPAMEIPGSFLTRDETEVDEFVGAVIRVNVDEGQPVSHSMVVLPGERGFMAAVLAPDSRAVSIAVSATTGISGFVFPGDRVDILLTQSIEGRQVTETLLEDIRVLAVDQRSDTDDRDPVIASTVTLEVTPGQAKTISVAGSLGQISLSLRSLFNTVESAVSLESESDATAPPDNGGQPIWDYEVSDALKGGITKKSAVQGWNVEVMRGPSVGVQTF